MPVHFDAQTLARPVSVGRHDYDDQATVLVMDVVRVVNLEMRGKPPHMVYEMLVALLRNRLPGVEVDEDTMRGVAAEIAFGLLAVGPSDSVTDWDPARLEP